MAKEPATTKKPMPCASSPPSASETPLEDDGHTVAPMNIEGMPWYNPKAYLPQNPASEPLSVRNLWRYASYAVLSGLLIVLVFGLGAGIFLWFCTHVWFG